MAAAKTGTLRNDVGHQADIWAAEKPYTGQPAKHPRPGGKCGQCGQPTTLSTPRGTFVWCDRCPGRQLDASSRRRTAIALRRMDADELRARESAQPADPAAERTAAEALASDRAELLDNLNGLADLLDVDRFPRVEPYTTARRAGIRYGARVKLYIDRARKAETLDQLGHVAADADQFAEGITPWLDRIADLRDELNQANDHGDAIPGQVEPDDNSTEALGNTEQLGEYPRNYLALRQPQALPAGRSAWSPVPAISVAGPLLPWCQRGLTRSQHCRATATLYAGGSVQDGNLCPEHLAEAAQECIRLGYSWRITGWHVNGTERVRTETMVSMLKAAAVSAHGPASPADVMRFAGFRFRLPGTRR